MRYLMMSALVPFTIYIAICSVGIFYPLDLSATSWSLEEEEEGCLRYKGSKQGDILPIKIVCTWPLSTKAVQKVLSRPQHYHRCFSRVKKSRLIHTPSKPKSLIRVYQIHDGSPASDRAVYLDYVIKQRVNEWILRFQQSPQGEVASIDEKWVTVKAHKGIWTVSKHTKGVQVSLQSMYDPGGSVPSFLVRWFMGSGVQKMMNELRRCAQKTGL